MGLVRVHPVPLLLSLDLCVLVFLSSHTHTHSLSLFLSLTHAHTQTHSTLAEGWNPDALPFQLRAACSWKRALVGLSCLLMLVVLMTLLRAWLHPVDTGSSGDTPAAEEVHSWGTTVEG